MSESTYDDYRWRRASRAYDFLQRMQQEQRPFTLQDVQQATGYSMETIKAYQTKIWKSFLAKHPSGGWLCQGLCPWEAFANLHRQRRDPEVVLPPPVPTKAGEARSQNADERHLKDLLRHLLAGWLVALLKKVEKK